MLGFAPISSTPVSALLNESSALLSISLSAKATLEAVMQDPYADFVRTPSARRVYTVELSLRAVV